ncbi:hypothetical protein MKX01_030726 [Papaver californicum]|nr:hypothetical protein MKX01_030726 [Papaver californicum]
MKRSREDNIVSKEQTVAAAASDYLKAVKSVFQDNKEKYAEFLQIVIGATKSQTKDIADLVAVSERVKALLKGHPQLILAFNAFLPKEYQITPTLEDGGDVSKMKRPCKSIQSSERIECSNEDLHPVEYGQQCTPSYWLLLHPIPFTSQTTEHEYQVLNNVCALDADSPDTVAKPKSRYEKMETKCEDYRFDLDVLIGSVDSTTKRVEELVGKIQDNTIKPETRIQIEDHLTAVNLRCIERLYGDYGLEILDILRKNTIPALLTILKRLKQKQEELSCDRSEFNKVWAETRLNNYDTSSDKRILRYVSSK